MLSVLRSKVAISIVARASVQLYALVIMLFAGRLLAPERFGEFAAAWLVVVILYTLVYIGFYEYILRSRAFEKVVDTCFWMIFSVGCGGAGITLVLAAVSDFDPRYANLPSLFLSMAPLPILTAPMAWAEAILIRGERLRVYNLCLIVAETVGAGVAVAGLLNGMNVYSLVAWRMTAVCIAAASFLFFAGRLPRFIFRPKVAMTATRRVLPLYGGRILEMVSNFGADFVIAIFLNPAAVGIYRIASRVTVAAADLFFQPLRVLTWSRFSRDERTGGDMRATYLEHLMLLTVLVWPALVVLAAHNSAFVTLVLGPEWKAAESIITILALARMAMVFDVFFEAGMVCNGRPKTPFFARLGFLALLLTNLFMLTRQGPEQAAIAVLVSNSAYGLFAAVFLAVVLRASALRVLKALAPGILIAIVCWAAAKCALVCAGLLDLSQLAAFGALAAAAALAWIAGVFVMVRRGMIHIPRL